MNLGGGGIICPSREFFTHRDTTIAGEGIQNKTHARYLWLLSSGFL